MRKIILLFLIAWPLVAAWINTTFSVNPILYYYIYYGLPSIILSIHKPLCIKKALFVSTFILPLITVVDYIAESTGTWIALPSMFPFRLFNHVNLDALPWAFLQIYLAIMFYQYFFEKKYYGRFWDKRSKEALFLTTSVFIIFLLTLIAYPHFLNIPYFYLLIGILIILPAIIFEDIKYPLIFPKLLKTALYFFYLNLVYEIIGLKMGWWSYESKQFIGYVSVFGATFPFEEFIFWIALFTLSVLSYYEYFFNREQ
jgi:hypothetical protein